MGIVMTLAFLISGCGIRPVGGPFQVNLSVWGNTVYSSDQDLLLGEVVFPGPPGLKTEAVVYLDGEYFKTIRSEGWEPARVSRLGLHVISAEVFWVKDGIRMAKVGCFRRQFEISAYNRNAYIPGFWWRTEIWSSPYC